MVPLENSTAIRQAALGGNVCRMAFSALTPGSYLVLSFPMISADELYRQAQLLREQGLHAEALTLIEDALELDPEHFEAWTRKGILLRQMGRCDDAMVAVEKSLELNAYGGCICASSISMVVSALKGSSRVSIWYMTIPRE